MNEWIHSAIQVVTHGVNVIHMLCGFCSITILYLQYAIKRVFIIIPLIEMENRYTYATKL